ncbi:MAG: nucleotidyltransferase domain-containing protein [Natronospirillum sp.]
MRISDSERAIITTILHKHFGAASQIRVFGSRVDDSAKGGDIDLYIEPELESAEQLVDAKLNALVELRLALGEQKIDLVINRRAGVNLPIYSVAKETGLVL